MRDYGLKPWHVDGVVGLTHAELHAVVEEQNARWKAIEAAQQQQKRRR